MDEYCSTCSTGIMHCAIVYLVWQLHALSATGIPSAVVPLHAAWSQEQNSGITPSTGVLWWGLHTSVGGIHPQPILRPKQILCDPVNMPTMPCLCLCLVRGFWQFMCSYCKRAIQYAIYRIKSTCRWLLSDNAGSGLPGVQSQEPGCSDIGISPCIPTRQSVCARVFFFFFIYFLRVPFFLPLQKSRRWEMDLIQSLELSS